MPSTAAQSLPSQPQSPLVQPAASPSRPRLLHKRMPSLAPKPCTNGFLPPWISLKSRPRNSRSESVPLHGEKSKKPRRLKIKPEEALRSLRGSYLPLHHEEQRRIPLMASLLNVSAAHDKHQQHAADRFEEIHCANKDLKAKLAEFTARRRAWNRKPQRKSPPPGPYNAIADFDKPDRPPVSTRQLYRTNAKLWPPARSCYDTSNFSSLFVRDPTNDPRSKQPLSPPSE